MPGLLTCQTTAGETVLIIGTGTSQVLAMRAQTLLDHGANVVFAGPQLLSGADEAIKYIDTDVKTDKITSLIASAGREAVGGFVDRVFVTLPMTYHDTKHQIYQYCVRNRVPINTSDLAQFSTFTLLSTFAQGDFQFGVTTGGKGCKLALRIKRELASALPANIGDICDTVGALRQRLQHEDGLEVGDGDHDDDAITTSKLNELVHEFGMTPDQKKLQRTRWLSQIVEYYPLVRLAQLSIDDLTVAYTQSQQPKPKTELPQPAKGSIALVGAGPGSVALLTVGAMHAIQSADIVLADKLVPQQVLDLIPQQRTELFIARKFPGNAEAAQQELLDRGLAGLEQNLKVVRLKQGDPYIFGRGGEEYNFFASKGYTPTVIPGLTLALAAPVLANIPATHREVADQVLICTGTGRRGAVPQLPEFVPLRTTVFLMTLHRIVEFIPQLIEKGWDPQLPVVVAERASSPDQRVIRTTLSQVAAAMEACGLRPPGLLITGYACNVIYNKPMAEGQQWVVEEGCNMDSIDLLAFLQ